MLFFPGADICLSANLQDAQDAQDAHGHSSYVHVAMGAMDGYLVKNHPSEHKNWEMEVLKKTRMRTPVITS